MQDALPVADNRRNGGKMVRIEGVLQTEDQAGAEEYERGRHTTGRYSGSPLQSTWCALSIVHSRPERYHDVDYPQKAAARFSLAARLGQGCARACVWPTASHATKGSSYINAACSTSS